MLQSPSTILTGVIPDPLSTHSRRLDSVPVQFTSSKCTAAPPCPRFTEKATEGNTIMNELQVSQRAEPFFSALYIIYEHTISAIFSQGELM